MAIARRNTVVNDGGKTSTSVNKSTGTNYVSSYKPTTASSQGNTPTTYSNGSKSAPASTSVKKVTGSNYVSSKKNTAPVTTYSNGTTYAPKSTPVSYNEGKNYISSMATPQQVKKVYQQYGVIPSDTPSNDDAGGYRGGGSSGSSGSDGSYSSGSGSYPSAQRDVDDTLDKIKELLSEQQKRQNEYFQEQYNQTLAKNKEEYERNRNKINLNYARGDRFLRSVYGDAVSGQGLSNRARNNSNWQTNLATNLRNYTNNDSTALSNFNMNKANAASQLAQGWYNYVLPVYTNRATNADDFEYRKYLASLNL